MAFDYAAGHQMMDAFKAGFESAGGTVVGEAYPPLGETKDFGPYLAKAKAANPDAVYRLLRRRGLPSSSPRSGPPSA